MENQIQTGSDRRVSKRVNDIYRASIKKSLDFIKNTSRFDDLLAKSIPIEMGKSGFLIPLTALHLDDRALAETLSKWRIENAAAFPSQFEVTLEGTIAWMRRDLHEVSDRILFIVTDHHGKHVGQMGYTKCLNDDGQMEIENVVRGDKSASPGLMGKALKALLVWAEDMVAPERIILRVFRDNADAVAFYKKNHFVADGLIPLRAHKNARGEVSYLELDASDKAPADKSFLRMVYKPDRKIVGLPEADILTAGPAISAREASYALDAARYGWNTQWGAYIKKFENQFAEYVGTKFALSTSSCTGALHLALKALGIGPGDEVIVPDVTWVATASAVIYCGGTPVFADIDPVTWCLDPKSFESKITPKTKAVIPVHLYGHPADMDRILEIARKHKLYVVEDAAPSIGTEYKGKRTGGFGDIAAFSFQGGKLAVTGEGGMVVTNNPELYDKLYSLWDHGRDLSRTFWIKEAGLKYKMSNIQAAIGLGQLERIDEMIQAKRRIFEWYREGLQGVKEVTMCAEPTYGRSIYAISSFYLDETAKICRDSLMAEMKKRKIDTRPVFPAISQYPIWPTPQQTQPIAKRIGAQSVNLPSGVLLRREQVDYVCQTIADLLKR